jgi:hypothetical protein
MPNVRRSKADQPRHEADEVVELKLNAFSSTVIRENVLLGYQERHDTRRIRTAAILFASLGAIVVYGMITKLGIEATVAYAAPISALAGAAATYLFRHGTTPGDVHYPREDHHIGRHS